MFKLCDYWDLDLAQNFLKMRQFWSEKQRRLRTCFCFSAVFALRGSHPRQQTTTHSLVACFHKTHLLSLLVPVQQQQRNAWFEQLVPPGFTAEKSCVVSRSDIAPLPISLPRKHLRNGADFYVQMLQWAATSLMRGKTLPNTGCGKRKAGTGGPWRTTGRG